MRLILCVALAFSLSFRQAPLPSASSGPPSSKVWLGHHAEFEEFLRTAPIDRTTNVSTGVLGIKRAFFSPGGLASAAALRSIRPGRYDGYFESYKSELAAYKLDRLIQLDMVPPTVERNVDGVMVSLQFWTENVRQLKEIIRLNLHAPDVDAWNRQVNQQKVFDDLIADIDDNQGNMLIDPVWNLIKVDHSRAFADILTIPFEIGDAARGVNHIDRPFLDRIKALDKGVVKREIGSFLEAGALDKLFSRRDTIVKAFEKLAARKGANQVFTP